MPGSASPDAGGRTAGYLVASSILVARSAMVFE